MGRPRGRTNADHDAKRRSLALAVAAHLAHDPSPEDSLRGLARAAGVSVPTLRHYFGDRGGVLAAAYEVLREQGAPFLARAADPGEMPLEGSIRALVGELMMGLAYGVGQVHAVGLTRGLGEEALGPAYLERLLEPTVEAVEARLAIHRDRDELREGDLRTAAVGLVAPLLVASLHQDHLGGRQTRPLDRMAFASEHAAAFLRAWARPGRGGATPR
jgi:AcrR family transcriptional regulator